MIGGASNADRSLATDCQQKDTQNLLSNSGVVANWERRPKMKPLEEIPALWVFTPSILNDKRALEAWNEEKDSAT